MNQDDRDVSLAILLAIRDIVGSDVKGVGPDTAALRAHKYCSEYDEEMLLAGAKFAAARGWLNVEAAIGNPMIGVNILEAGQVYLDDLGF